MRFGSRIVNLLGILLVLALWQAAGAQLGDALLATPVQVARALVETVQTGAFWAALWQMLWKMMLGYALALVIGIPLGVAMGRVPVVNAIVKPWASMFIVISAAAIVPLFIILMGRGLVFSTAIVFVVTVWYVVVTMTEAARSVSPKLLNVARSFAANDFQRFRYVILPSLHPFIMIAARVGLVHALRAMITAEMFISAGFGGLLNDAGLDLSTAPLFALIVALMIISVSMTSALRWIAHRSAPWYASRTGDR
ncbi:ABC transporter permease [Azospirillum canadense]|uniref:ABC transporter permease n=1 Tax=Azospirillum canadense TaxID=403962 RepID=UPI002226A584|nr:ABC transporter permease subunit [Azospirillum canadense]MCW2242103.1 ABC-type nitrate/sulfonate/bicarbonate transport system permease component [Azospirillum canadense]